MFKSNSDKTKRTLSNSARMEEDGVEIDSDAKRNSLSDEALMERYQNGDVLAFDILFSRHGNKLLNFIYRKVGNRALAEELLQEVFLRVVRSAHDYKRKAKFTTWVYAIARNQSIDALRRAKHRRHPSLDQPIGDEGNRTLGDLVANKSPGSDRRASDQQFTAALEEALDKLPDEQKEVFLLREKHHIPFKEIAEMTEVPINTVKSRMRYALEGLRTILNEFDPRQQE